MSPAKMARINAGLELAEAAQRARICVNYLRCVERGRGTCSYVLALRLARIYGCSANVFLYTNPGRETPQRQTRQTK